MTMTMLRCPFHVSITRDLRSKYLPHHIGTRCPVLLLQCSVPGLRSAILLYGQVAPLDIHTLKSIVHFILLYNLYYCTCLCMQDMYIILYTKGRTIPIAVAPCGAR
jgi:hypothetical protein